MYSKNPTISKNIHDVFHEFLSSLTKAGYGVVFIPQLYGNGNDYDLMCTFCCDTNDYFVVTASDELKTLSKDTIENRFEQLVNHYDEYKKYLCNKHTFMKSEAHKTTDILETVLERKEKAQ